MSSATAERRSVSPIDVNVTRSGLTTITEGGTAFTVISALASASPAAAVTFADPASSAVTSPDWSTVTTDSSEEDQRNTAPTMAVPPPSKAVAAIRSVSPRSISWETGSRTIFCTSCITVSVARPTASPAFAVITAIPLPTAAARPVLSTVATEASLVDQDNATSGMAAPCWSRTSALS